MLKPCRNKVLLLGVGATLILGALPARGKDHAEETLTYSEWSRRFSQLAEQSEIGRLQLLSRIVEAAGRSLVLRLANQPADASLQLLLDTNEARAVEEQRRADRYRKLSEMTLKMHEENLKLSRADVMLLQLPVKPEGQGDAAQGDDLMRKARELLRTTGGKQ